MKPALGLVEAPRLVCGTAVPHIGNRSGPFSKPYFGRTRTLDNVATEAKRKSAHLEISRVSQIEIYFFKS